MIVVDASLATKWLFDEDDSLRALALLKQNREKIAAPDLLLSEVTSGIVRRANCGEIPREDALDMLGHWTGLWDDGLVQSHPLTAGLVHNAAEIAITLGHPLADCIYLALAIDLGCDLATCDAKFQAKAAKHYRQTKLLRDFDA